jgi:hypothetical protein
MKRAIVITALLLLSFSFSFGQEEDEDSSTGLPDEYSDYLIASKTLSPDKKIAVIYPTSDLCDDPKPGPANRCQDYLVAFEPFRILTKLETQWPFFKNESHGGLSAEWSKDGAAVLVTLDRKWGPGDIFLYEIHDGKLTRATNLLRKVHDLLVPDYKKSKAPRYNDYFDFIFDTEDNTPVCEFIDAGHVRIRGNATNDPKSSERHNWTASVEATWDIAQAKFTSQKVKRGYANWQKDN